MNVEMLTGYYFDPKHGGCLRRIVGIGEEYRVIGVYGSDEASVGVWHAVVTPGKASWRGYVPLTVNFTGKTELTHALIYRARYWPVYRSITWEDGNRWTRMYVHPSQLRVHGA